MATSSTDEGARQARCGVPYVDTYPESRAIAASMNVSPRLMRGLRILTRYDGG